MSLVAPIIAAATRRLPLMSGCNRLAYGKLPMPPHPSESRPLRTRWGHDIIAPIGDLIGRSVYYFGDLDPKVCWTMRRFAKRGDTVVDIGANIGLVSLAAAQQVGLGGRVFAFEPQPNIAAMLRESIDRNHLSQVCLRPEALGREDAEMTLHVPEENYGGASLMGIAEGDAESNSFPVPVRDASALFDELEIGDSAFVKMDVEGFEPEVIRGALPYWERHPPRAILFEFKDEGGVEGSEVGSLLGGLGYSFHALPSRLFRPALVPVGDLAPGERTSHDFVAVL